MSRPQIVLIKPTRYDDEGYPLRWWRSLIPSNSLACLVGIVQDALARGVLGPEGADLTIIDEINTRVDHAAIMARIRRAGGRGLVAMVGVQSNQFPRALDLGRRFRKEGLPVCIGGFHVSGCLAMLKELPAELAEAKALGISLFAGEAEDGRIDSVLTDAFGPGLKPLYDFSKTTPNLAGSPIPLLPPEMIGKDIDRLASFDLGRGCPFECSFCTIINVQGRKSRFRTPDDLEKIVRANAAVGVSQFFLTDDNFARNKQWEPLVDRLLLLRKQGFRVRLAMQVDALAHRIPNFIDKCVAAGADQIFIGLESINADNLEQVKKRQNRIEEYRKMFQDWKRHSVVITCGYIIGFPNDSYNSIMRDMQIIKEELPIDAIYLNFLTPLPGSEDHRTLLNAGVWMDPDMNRYDLNHRVTRHPKMTDGEWDRAFHDAHKSFFSFEHMETILRRMVALRSVKRNTTIHRLLGYRESMRLEGVVKLEAGIWRKRERLDRRPGMPVEPFLRFHARQAMRHARTVIGGLTTYARLRAMLFRIQRDPQRYAYTDAAIGGVMEDGGRLLTETRVTDHARRRQARVAEATASAGP
jgi:pyruvate-formate lyase-activating enzyme